MNKLKIIDDYMVNNKYPLLLDNNNTSNIIKTQMNNTILDTNRSEAVMALCYNYHLNIYMVEFPVKLWKQIHFLRKYNNLLI